MSVFILVYAEELFELVQLSEVPVDKELFKVVGGYNILEHGLCSITMQ